MGDLLGGGGLGHAARVLGWCVFHGAVIAPT
jgi:ABC-type methionine transport system permease subunit